ncbi:MAG: DNA-protecting protein DprA, partial [Anaerolineales bacterium]
MGEETSFWLAFSHVPGVGSVRITRLLDAFGSLERAWHVDAQALRSAGIGPKTTQSILRVRSELNLEDALARVHQLGVRIITLVSADYPEALRHIQGPPAWLFVKGGLLESDRFAVAMVGTRRASAYGKAITEDLASELASMGLTIISGLARGIDAIAHQAALSAEGRTLAVLGSGIDQIYPSEHRRLAGQICEHGALVSEYPPGTLPEGHHFPARNRIIAGLAMGVIVIEAAERSGALITADFAAEQGKDVFAVPGDINRKTSRGTNRLIQDGAHPLLAAVDVMEILNLRPFEIGSSEQTDMPGDEVQVVLLKLLGEAPAHIDVLYQKTGLPIHEIQAALSMLELRGM